jgi:hypothetical protein
VGAPGGRGEPQLRPSARPAAQTRPQRHRSAEGDEYTEERTAQAGGQVLQGTERRLGGRSLKVAATQARAVRQRLAPARQEIALRTVRRQGQPRFTQAADLRAAAEQLGATPRVGGLGSVSVSVEPPTPERPRRCSGARPAGGRGASTRTVAARVTAAALATTLRSWGGRVSATTQSARQLSLTQAVRASRAEYLVEHGCGRLKGKALALPPL